MQINLSLHDVKSVRLDKLIGCVCLLQHKPHSITDLCHALKITRPTGYKMVQILEKHGVIAPSNTHRYPTEHNRRILNIVDMPALWQCTYPINEQQRVIMTVTSPDHYGNIITPLLPS